MFISITHRREGLVTTPMEGHH